MATSASPHKTEQKMKLARFFGGQRSPRRNGKTLPSRRDPRNWVPRVEYLEQRDNPSTAFAVSAAGNALLRFDTANPTATTSVAVSGLAAGEVLDGISFRTQTGQFYALALNSTTHLARLGTINLSTGAFTSIGAAINIASGADNSISFDPVNDRLTLITDTGINLSVNPNDATVTAQTGITGAATISGLAYSNNFKGALSTTLFGIDASTDQLVTINANTGAVTPIGVGLGVGNVTATGGLAIQSDGTALANLSVAGVSAMFSINLNTGIAVAVGNIGASAVVSAGLAVAPISVQVSGSGPGMVATVTVQDSVTGNVKTTLHPFGLFGGGVHVAMGDVNADGVADIVVGADAGGGPHVVVYDGLTQTVMFSFFAYNAGFTGGVFVAAGDVDGDGHADIITGAGAGGGPHVKVFSGATGNLLSSFFAYSAGFAGGVSVAAGDVDLVGGAGVQFMDEIITGAGAGGGPHVRVFNQTGTQIAGSLGSFFAYNAGFAGGVFVGAGDVNGDGHADVITGAGAGGGPHVKAFSGLNGGLLDSFFAADASFRGGMRVGVADVDGNGRLDIMTGTGAGVRGTVTTFDGLTLAQLDSFFVFDAGFLGGVHVGGI